MGAEEWWQGSMAHHGGSIERRSPGHIQVTASGYEEDGLEILREKFEEYKKECEVNKQLLKDRYEEQKSREYRGTRDLQARYEEKKRQSEEDKQRLRERHMERKSRARGGGSDK